MYDIYDYGNIYFTHLKLSESKVCRIKKIKDSDFFVGNIYIYIYMCVCVCVYV